MYGNFCPNCGLPLHGLNHAIFCPGCKQDLGRQPPTALVQHGPAPAAWQPVAFDGGGTWRRYSTFDSSVPLALPAPTSDGGSVTASRRSPARPPEFMADVIVPAGQAGLIGLAIGIIFIFCPLVVGGFPWWGFAPIGVLSFSVFVLVLLHGNRKHMWNEETVTQDAAPVEVAPAPAGEVKLIINHTDGDGGFIRGLNLTLPPGVSQTKFYEFARGVTRRGGRLAVVDWTGQGKPFSKKVYDSLLSVLDEAGIVEWKDNANRSTGRRLTDDGQAALMGFCEDLKNE